MKRTVVKWLFRIVLLLVLFVGSLLMFVLNPGLWYKNKTVIGNYTVYHNVALDGDFHSRLNESVQLVSSSELFDPAFKMDICLNDGSWYPSLIGKLEGPAFGFGFYNKVVIMAAINSKENTAELNGYKWNLVQLLAHEQIHCFQFKRFGLTKSNPIAGYPDWKWDGYNEYIARRSADQLRLSANIDRLTLADSIDKGGWGIRFADSTFMARDYYKWWLLMQYAMNIKKMTYQQILADTTSENKMEKEMISWKKKEDVATFPKF